MSWKDDKLGLALVLIPIMTGLVQLVAMVSGIFFGTSVVQIVIFGSGAVMVIATMVLASRDARQNGGEASLLILFFWIVGYPVYMRDRAQRGAYFGGGSAFIGIFGFFLPIIVSVGIVAVLSGRHSTSHTLPSPNIDVSGILAGMGDGGVPLAKCSSFECTVTRITPETEAMLAKAGKAGTHIAFDPHATADDIATIRLLPHTTSLAIREHTATVDLTPLAALHELTELQLYASHVGPLDPIAELPLETLDLGNVKGITSFAPLKKLTSLRHAKLFGIHFGELDALVAMTALEDVDLGQCELSSLAGIEALTKLKALNFFGCLRLGDLQPVAKLPSLTTLEVRSVGLKSLAALAPLKKLETLDAGTNDITELSPLAGMTALKRLTMSSNRRLKNLAPLAGMKTLETIDLADDVDVDSIASIANLPDLRTLYVAHTKVTSYAPLAKSKSLRDLRVSKDAPTAQIDELKAAIPTLKVSVQ